MARYTGPVCRLCRRLGDKLYLKGEKCFTPKCPFEKRPYPPGQRSTRRRKVSDRGLQLREKQRGRAVYGILERQFQRYYQEAAKRPSRRTFSSRTIRSAGRAGVARASTSRP